jgi:hypothetical protein
MQNAETGAGRHEQCSNLTALVFLHSAFALHHARALGEQEGDHSDVGEERDAGRNEAEGEEIDASVHGNLENQNANAECRNGSWSPRAMLELNGSRFLDSAFAF